MKLNQVPARTGIQWVKMGMRTFASQPFALTGLFVMFMLAVSLLSLVPVLGQVVALALLPAATLGLMAATREAASGKFPMPTILASAFQAGKERVRSMLMLGAIYAVGSIIIMGISTLLAGGAAPVALPPPEGAESASSELVLQPGAVRSLVITMLLYIPLGLLFWHAPALVHWHGVSPAKSLFFSALACWTNKAALLFYFLSWLGVFFVASLVLVLVASLLGGPQVLGFLMFPIAMVLSAMFFSSLYFTFRDSFVGDEGQAVG
jgi:hypothetical protein